MAVRARAVEIDRRYTSDEFEAMPEFDGNFELLSGRIVEKEMPGFQHGHIAGVIRDAYRSFDSQKLLGVMEQEVSIRLDSDNTPTPDVSFWKIERKPSNKLDGAAPIPDLAIEVLSPRDIKSKNRLAEVMVKIRKYQLAGIQMVWVINPKTETVEIYSPNQVTPVKTLKVGDQLDGAEVIPGFTLKIADLFA